PGVCLLAGETPHGGITRAGAAEATACFRPAEGVIFLMLALTMPLDGVAPVPGGIPTHPDGNQRRDLACTLRSALRPSPDSPPPGFPPGRSSVRAPPPRWPWERQGCWR